MDNDPGSPNDTSGLASSQEGPNANSTMNEQSGVNQNVTFSRHASSPYSSLRNETPRTGENQDVDLSSYNIGNMSHIPRVPPTPATYTIPSVMNRSAGNDNEQDNIFGMIELKANDVCYTSGTIEWVGRKRSFPINSGFKLVKEDYRYSEPILKKIKRFDRTHTSGGGVKECECADVLPTVNAIVDHLNAIHEAVDLVDLRLNTLEDVISKNG